MGDRSRSREADQRNGGLEKGQEKGEGKGGLRKGLCQDGLETGQGKGGLRKGLGKGGLEKGKAKGGLRKGHGKGGLKKGQEESWQAHAAMIQEEQAAGFDPALQESRGRRSRWARQERRKDNPETQEKAREYLQGAQRPETRPGQSKMKVGSQKWRTVTTLAAQNARAQADLDWDRANFLSRKQAEGSELEEKIAQVEACKKASASSSSRGPETRPASSSDTEMEDIEVDFDDL